MGPIIVNPIVSSPGSAGKYSIETKTRVSSSSGSNDNIYTGTVSTAVLGSDRALDFYNSTVPTISNIIRDLVTDTYVDPIATTSGTVAANYGTLAGFQAYYAGAATGTQLAKINAITKAWYNSIKNGGAHVAVDPAVAQDIDVCATAGGRLFVSEVSACIAGGTMCYKIIIAA